MNFIQSLTCCVLPTENNVGLIVGLSVPLGLMLFIPILCVSAACYCKAKTRRRFRTHVVATPRGNHEIIVVTSSNLTSQSSGVNPSSTDFHESSLGFPLEAPPPYSTTPEPTEQVLSILHCTPLPQNQQNRYCLYSTVLHYPRTSRTGIVYTPPYSTIPQNQQYNSGPPI